MMNARFTVYALLLSAAFAAGAGAARDAAPAVSVPVGPATTAADPATGALTVRVALPPEPPRPVLAAARPDRTPVGRRLARLVAQGRAAGNWGDVYDNRDRGHSLLPSGRWPLLAFAVYEPAFQDQRLDYGLNDRLVFDAIVLGNSSTALRAGPHWRSLPRLALTRGDGAAALRRLYGANHVYVFPEHRDHDPEHGDLLPANTPYFLVSQGSSGSDQALLRSVGLALAALPPPTKAFLRARGLVAPAIQTLIRRAAAPDATEEGYLSGAAHPAVFAEAPDPDRLIDLAQAMTAATAPALAAIEVLDEQAVGPPADALGDSAAERLLDAPEATARVALGPAPLRRYILRATGRAPDGGPARVVWRVLRGTGVRLTPLDPAGEVVRVEVPWQTPAPVPGRPDVASTRVDVAAFAEAGAGFGPPSFFSVHFSQDRGLTLDAGGRLVSLDWAAPAAGAYVDPVLVPLRPWRDDFRYADDGTLLGWTRTRADGADDYDRFGRRVLTRDPLGRPERTQAVAYRLGKARSADARRPVIEEPIPDHYVFRYAGPEDVLGALDRP